MSIEIHGGVLDIWMPVDPRQFKSIRLNLVEYHRERVVKVITRVAPVKYTERIYREVDRLLRKGYHHQAAYKEVAERHGFDPDNFGRAHREWLRKLQRWPTSTE